VEWKGLCTAVQPEKPKPKICRTFALLLCRCRANASGGAYAGPERGRSCHDAESPEFGVKENMLDTGKDESHII